MSIICFFESQVKREPPIDPAFHIILHSKNLMQYSLRATQAIEDEIGSWSKVCHKTTHYHSKTPQNFRRWLL